MQLSIGMYVDETTYKTLNDSFNACDQAIRNRDEVIATMMEELRRTYAKLEGAQFENKRLAALVDQKMPLARVSLVAYNEAGQIMSVAHHQPKR